MDRELLRAVIHQSLGAGSSVATLFGVDMVLVGQSALGEAKTVPPISIEEYQYAVDQRQAEVFHCFDTDESAVALVELRGRHVGALGEVIPAGRRFTTFAHLYLTKRATGDQLRVISGLPRALTRTGVQSLMGSRASAENLADLRVEDVHKTVWARRWKLAPRLARVALLLMGGLRPQQIAEQLNVSLKSVRTYTEQLFFAANVGSRAELPMAALRVASPSRLRRNGELGAITSCE